MRNETVNTRIRRPWRRRRGTARLFVLGATFLASTGLAPLAVGTVHAEVRNAASSQASDRPVTPALTFSIPPAPLGDVLDAFQKSTQIKVVLADAAIAMIQSPGVVGSLQPRQALEALLMGTSVSYSFTAANVVSLQLRAAGEFVNVSAASGPALTSTRFTEPLRDIPQTVTVVPADVIQAQGATTLRDVLKNVTGISIQAGEGGVPAGDNLSIRGFNARTDMFIDGVRDVGGYSRDPFNVEQVEVVKGPSSSMAGRGSTGGIINLATKAPHAAAVRNVSLGIGSTDFKRGSIDINQPIGTSTGAAFRVNAMWHDAGTPGRDAVSSQRWGFAPAVAVGLGTPTRITADYAHLGQNNVPDYGIPWVPNANVPLAAYADQAPPVDYGNFYGLTSRDYENTRTDIATARVEHDFNSALSLRAVVRGGRTNRDSLITSPRFESSASTAIRRTDWKSRDQTDGIVAMQADLTSRFRTGVVSHALVSGVDFARETSENWNRLEQGGVPPTTDLFNPDFAVPYASRLVRDGAVTGATAHSAAAFALDTVEITPRFEVSGGVRWDRLSLAYRSVAAAGGDARLDRTDDMVSWRGGAVFKPQPRGSVYLGVGTSLNPSTEGLSLSVSTVAVDPEKSRSVEAGTKWSLLAGRLDLNAAVFNTTKSNARTPGINAGDPPIVLDGEQTVSGVEVGVNGAPAERWQLFGGYTFMDSEITSSNTAAEVGKAFANTPRHSFSLWTTYRLPHGVDVGGGAQYMGDRFNGNTGTRLAPGYWLADAMAAYRVTDQLTLRVNGQNMTNERYIDRLSGGHFIPGPGRSVKVTAAVGF
jgi:catecholate siderophore receptor